MKILFASTVFPHPGNPTRGTYNLALCRAFASLRSGNEAHEVKVVAPRMWPDVLKNRSGEPLDTSGIVDIAYPTFWYLPGRGRRRLGERLDRSCWKTVQRVTQDWKPDVVLSYWADPDGTAALEWATRLDAKFALIVGGSDVLMMPHRPGMEGLIEDVVCRADLVRTVSDQLTRAVEELCPSAPHIACVRQGVDGTRFHDGDQASARRNVGLEGDLPTLLWVGRVDPVKNLGLLLDAFVTVVKQTPSRLVLVGDGPDMPLVRSKIAEHSLQDHVRVVGAVPPESLGDWYRAADATVMSSHSEGLPNVLRESLACGRPFASVNVGGISEIGDDTCRILCDAGDTTQLANAMTAILDPVYRESAIAYPVRTWADAAIDLETSFLSVVKPKAAKAPCAKSQPRGEAVTS